jgi:hypothetical protein
MKPRAVIPANVPPNNAADMPAIISTRRAPHSPSRRRKGRADATRSGSGRGFWINGRNERTPERELSMDKTDQDELLQILNNQFKAGFSNRVDILRAKMELETADSQLRSATASERNAQYMLWSVVAAAVSALASLASTIIAVFVHH